jgi:anti-sigma factor RsiW
MPLPRRQRLDDAEACVLSALDAVERHAFETHAADCPQCAALVHRVAQATVVLAATLPRLNPPAQLRDRLLGALQSRTARRP